MFIRFLFIQAIFFLVALTSFGARGRVQLSCEHINILQNRYLVDHIGFFKKNNQLKERVITSLLKIMDSGKIYLLQGDVKETRQYFSTLFKDVENKKCVFFDKFYTLYLLRLKERIGFIKNYLSNKKFKFDKKTRVILDFKKRKRPRTTVEANKTLQAILQYQLANLQQNMNLKEARSFLLRQYERNQKRRVKELDEEKFSLYLNAFANALDPHSIYLSWKNLEDFRIDMQRSLDGVGARLSSVDGYTVINEIIPGGALAKEGTLQEEDKITAVAQGKGGIFENIIEMDLSDVVRKIRGRRGSIVRLRILRETEDKKKKIITVTVIRAKIPLEEAQVHYVDHKIGGQKAKLAIVRLHSFYADFKSRKKMVSRDVEMIKRIGQRKVQGVVLDLSNNGGGSLDEAVRIAGLFIKKGAVVKQSRKGRATATLADRDPLIQYKGPLVVLVNNLSASASEIVAGALQDYKRAVIVGSSSTYGKGTVQTVDPLHVRGLGALKITVGMFFIPSGKTTQHSGVSPDISLPTSGFSSRQGEMSELYSLKPRSISPFKSLDIHSKKKSWTPVSKKALSYLMLKSQDRLKKNKKFKKAVAAEKKNSRSSVTIGEVLKDLDKAKTGEEQNAVSKRKTANQIQKDKLKKYLERLDIMESLNVLSDYILFQNKNISKSVVEKFSKQ